MKKLQNNFTTPEQSKRLLELGVPADSADCYLLRSKHTATFYPHVLISETYTQLDKFLNVFDYFPCWSVGRLIEIFELCTGKKFERRIDRPIVEDVKCRIAFYIFHHKFDFSKLEE